MAHTGILLPKVFANCLSVYAERKTILPQEECGVRPRHSIVDMVFVV